MPRKELTLLLIGALTFTGCSSLKQGKAEIAGAIPYIASGFDKNYASQAYKSIEKGIEEPRYYNGISLLEINW